MKQPRRSPGRPRKLKPTGRAAQFVAGLNRLEMSVGTFASRCGIQPSTVHRWIRDNAVPDWAIWIVELLLGRRGAAEQFSRPA